VLGITSSRKATRDSYEQRQLRIRSLAGREERAKQEGRPQQYKEVMPRRSVGINHHLYATVHMLPLSSTNNSVEREHENGPRYVGLDAQRELDQHVAFQYQEARHRSYIRNSDSSELATWKGSSVGQGLFRL